MPVNDIKRSSKRKVVEKKAIDRTAAVDKLESETAVKEVLATDPVKLSAPTTNPLPGYLTLGGSPLGVRGPLLDRKTSVTRSPRIRLKDHK